MREVAFLRKNADKWKKFEQLLKNKSNDDPDQLADLYIELSADLAYAQANYPGSKTEQYLNQLSVAVHDEIYRSKKEETGRIITFWTQEIPRLFATKQKELLYSFIVFSLAIGIGILSSINDPSFVRFIMGDAYVNMTISNINEGDPLAVYKKAEEMDMFFAITVNNVRVSFYAFVSGLLTSIGVGVVLLNNGVMVGAFLHFFAEYGLIGEALRVIFIHGSLELSAIVIAGAAGFVVGNGFLFPGTYSRKDSFIKAGREGLKMIVGLVPIFIAAGFLESFVTRYTNMPIWLSLFIIFSSLAFILYYFVLLPMTLKEK
ncbi:MAG: stage II sporulation protein M [Gracilimonas sp.]|uniref:stage II sporulation protein M n=1 Tax=Gracilimonas sp. TaxID=1974203 RepID=UPI0019A88092|nr:stage II sporulation protein M [Gracilimonas sp.]MBD3616332.1 stage II sporulation protein M [Gracilimonas sp.]